LRKKAVVLIMLSVFLLLLPGAAMATVQKVTLSVYPLTPGTASQYNIGFYTSGSGALEGGRDRIIIEFPEGTVIPSNISSDKILINGKGVSSSYIYVSDNVLTLKLPSSVDIDAESYAGIIISQTAGIKTPLRGGTYYILVSTTNDSAAKSNSFSVEGTKISSLEVAVSPATADEYAEYEISFKTSSKGALTGGEDYIYIEFPEEADLPRTISNSYIEINDKKSGSSGIEVNRDTNTVAVKVPSDLNIRSGSKVTVTIASGANIRNPDEAGKYELGVYTSRDSLLVEEIYSVGLSISTPVVVISPADGGKNSQYSIGFTTSSNGTLSAGEGYIYLYFPSGTTVPGSISSSYVTVNGYTARSVTCTKSERKIAVRIPSDINILKNSYVQVVIKSSAGVKNPSSGGKYRLEACTSADTGKVKSTEYTITGTASSASKPEVDLSTKKAGQYPDITIEFELGSGGDLEGGYDEIAIIFPDGFSLPGSLSRSDITIDGVRVAGYDISGNELVLTVPEDLYGGDNVEVVIKSSAGIKNPTAEGSYKLKIYTSQDSTKVESKSFSIGSASPAEQPQVELSSSTPGQVSQYLISIFASEDWDLEEWDSIIITFPNDTTLPSSISGSYIKINDEIADSVSVSSRTMTIGLPEDTVIDEGDKVVVDITSSAGIQNPTTSGSYKLEVVTPENDDPYESKPYQIGTGGGPAGGQVIIFRIGSKLASSSGALINLDTAPTIINNFTVVPLRALGDALGAETDYDNQNRSVTVKYNNKTLIFYIDSQVVKVDDQWVMADVPATLINNRVMIPARFVSQSYGAMVGWNPDTQEVSITR